MKKVLSILALIIFTSSSFADTYSARELNELSDKDELACATYIAGFLDGMVLGKDFRIKKGITVGTLENIFKKEINIHPEYGDIRAHLILSQLLVQYGITDYSRSGVVEFFYKNFSPAWFSNNLDSLT